VTRADLNRVTAPIRLYRSVEDHVVEPLSGRILHEGATSTTVEEILLQNSYHVATLDHDAELIHEGSVEFFRSLAPAAT
jgi:carboxylesterase